MRIAKELGYDRIITYILESETGISLKASGWKLEQEKCGGKQWTSHSNGLRTSETTDLFGTTKKYPQELKSRWSKTF